MISIVDDDMSLRTALVDLMESVGIPAVGFPDAEAFLQSDHADTSDCLIADVQMPGLNGLQLFERLVGSGRRIPTILITAYPEERIRTNALKAGVRQYMTKPFRNDALIAIVRSIIPVSEPAPQAGPKSIAILHPVESDRNYFRAILAEQGYEVIVAYDCDGLLAAARERRPDLFLVHAMRLDAVLGLKSTPDLSDIPIAVIASYTPEYVEAHLREKGVSVPMVPVPIGSAALAETVERCLRQTVDGNCHL